MSRTGDQITELSSDMLAQARGCFPDNDCYWDCCWAAERTLSGEHADLMDERQRLEREAELREALIWARARRWEP